ncbi:hypothetical protein PIB30_040209 [Stylosanthes scabra]|uniref:Uncharacterized protein n=1 Tax=Stylosanthes scabra TaxID=79078 RepID=A0ABU6RF47_9FABA|nr:hypothetical protein [Stylosanthes scabra]
MTMLDGEHYIEGLLKARHYVDLRKSFIRMRDVTLPHHPVATPSPSHLIPSLSPSRQPSPWSSSSSSQHSQPMSSQPSQPSPTLHFRFPSVSAFDVVFRYDVKLNKHQLRPGGMCRVIASESEGCSGIPWKVQSATSSHIVE